MLLDPAEEEEEEAILKYCWVAGCRRRRLSAEADDDEDVRKTKALVVVLKWLRVNQTIKTHAAVVVVAVEAAMELVRPKR